MLLRLGSEEEAAVQDEPVYSIELEATKAPGGRRAVCVFRCQRVKKHVNEMLSQKKRYANSRRRD